MTSDDCEPLYAWESTVNYSIGRDAAIEGSPESDNPWIRGMRPVEWMEYFRGWLSGKYGTK